MRHCAGSSPALGLPLRSRAARQRQVTPNGPFPMTSIARAAGKRWAALCVVAEPGLRLQRLGDAGGGSGRAQSPARGTLAARTLARVSGRRAVTAAGGGCPVR